MADYQGHIHGIGDYSGRRYFKLEVKDEILINGLNFFRFSENNTYAPFSGKYYFGYDSVQNILYVKLPGDTTIRTAIDFNIPKDSVFISYIAGMPVEYTSTGMFQISVMGDFVNCYGAFLLNGLDRRYYYFAAGKGLYKYYRAILGGPQEEEDVCGIVSAVIDTFIYNPIILNITGLSPLINRSINSFPFVIHCSYYTNVDITTNFRINYYFQRDTGIYYSNSGSFNSNGDFIMYLPDSAHSGDLLNLRVEIHDTSIFNNHAYFPDTGYAKILLLNVLGINDKNIVHSFRLEQNYPNPFNPGTIISYSLPSAINVKLCVYNTLGQTVKLIVDGFKNAGNYSVNFNASDLPSGIYFYKLEAGQFSQVKKMILIK
jgi:hypothetical protein